MKLAYSWLIVNFCLVAALVVLLFSTENANAQKLKPEDIIAKHLESIATRENRLATKNRLTVGTAKFRMLGQASTMTSGNAVVASEVNKFLIGMSFSANDYPFDKIGYDGKKLKASFIRPGVRSALGNFVLSMDKLNREGLLGGVLTDSWIMLNLPERKSVLEYEGTKKINDVETYVLGYSPKGGSGFKVKFYFDGQNFRHLLTEYLRLISAAQGMTPEASSRQRESRHQLVEDFSNFKTINNFTLPQTYRLNLTFEGRGDTSEFEWTINFSEFLFNQKLDPNSFDAEAK